MDFDLTPQQHRRYDAIAAAAREHPLTPPPTGPDAYAGRDAWLTAAKLGLTGLCLPAEHGGGGLGCLDTALCLNALTAAGTDTGLAFGIAAHLFACGIPVSTFAADDVGPDLLRGMSTGRTIAANAMTEDEAGSDVSRLRTTARRDGDAYQLDGVKSFVSNAPLADLFITYAVTAPDAGYLGLTAFAVPGDIPGLHVGAPLAKMGLHGCAAARVEFRGCRVPALFRLGAEGQGSAVFQASMGWERAALPAIYLGAMDHQLRRCTQHACERRQFGRRLADFQAVAHRLATMKQRLESARLLLHRACWLLDEGRDDATAAGAMSKIAVSEAAVANALDAIHLFGAQGYLAAGGIEAHLRDAVPSTLFSGTTEIQREIIAKEIGL